MLVGPGSFATMSLPSSPRLARVARVALLALAAWAAGCGGEETSKPRDGDGGEGVLVAANGRFGPLRIGDSREADLRAWLGAPARVRGIPGGRLVRYECGRGCLTTFFVRARDGRLSDVVTYWPRVRTAHGTRIGTSAARAAAREGRAVETFGCPPQAIVERSGSTRLVLGIDRDRVDVVWLHGPAPLGAICGEL